MKKMTKKWISILVAMMLLASAVSVYANGDYSIRKFVNGDLLRADGSYYSDVIDDSITYSNRRAVQNVIDINKNGYYITNDNVLHFYEGEQDKTLENVTRVSDADVNDYFYYLDTDGNLHHYWREYYNTTDTVVAGNIGKLKELDLKYALCENGDLYALGNSDSKRIDTGVKSMTLFNDGESWIKEALYLKNDGSLYSYDFNNHTSRFLLGKVKFYEVFLDSGWQIRAETDDNTRYKWGNNSAGEIYTKIVDGNNIAPEYVDLPMKITDNIVYHNEDVLLQADGKLYGKVWNENYSKYSTVLLDTRVYSIRCGYAHSYQYQKFNDDVCSVERDGNYKDRPFKKPVLECVNAVKGLGIFYNEGWYIGCEGCTD